MNPSVWRPGTEYDYIGGPEGGGKRVDIFGKRSESSPWWKGPFRRATVVRPYEV